MSPARNHSVGASFAAFRLAPRKVAVGLAFTAVVGGLSVVSPAVATAAPTAGICNGVVNQLAHRGMVQENLLKAAARKNADQLAQLQSERTALQTRADALAAQIADADK